VLAVKVVLMAVAVLGNVALNRQIDEQGVNLDFKLMVLAGEAAALAAALVVLRRRKRTS
jgi:hypothetical protein